MASLLNQLFKFLPQATEPPHTHLVSNADISSILSALEASFGRPSVRQSVSQTDKTEARSKETNRQPVSEKARNHLRRIRKPDRTLEEKAAKIRAISEKSPKKKAFSIPQGFDWKSV
jgi:type I restriction-modification system DNA methylase subunit